MGELGVGCAGAGGGGKWCTRGANAGAGPGGKVAGKGERGQEHAGYAHHHWGRQRRRGAGRTRASGLACLPEHSGPMSGDSGSDSGPSCEDSDSGLPGLLSPATPTLWWELPGPVIPLFPGSMAKLNMAKSRGALGPAIPCVGVENEAKGHFMGRSSTEMAQKTRKICILCLYLCISLTTKYTLGGNNIGRFLACFVSTNDLAVQ